MNERMNEWMNERVNNWVNEWVNGWMLEIEVSILKWCGKTKAGHLLTPDLRCLKQSTQSPYIGMFGSSPAARLVDKQLMN